MAFLKWTLLVLYLQFQGMFLPLHHITLVTCNKHRDFPLFFFSYYIFKDRFWFMYSHSVDSLKHIVLCIFPTVSHTQATLWTNDIPSSVKGLPGSCVVIPCSYDFPNPGKKLTQFTGIWTDHTKQAIFHSVQSKIMQQYRNRTELLGDLSQKNCSLKIDPLQQNDQGPFSFRIEIANYDKFSYRKRTVSITMMSKYDFH